MLTTIDEKLDHIIMLLKLPTPKKLVMQRLTPSHAIVDKFIDQRCGLHKLYETTTRDLYNEYLKYMKNEALRPLTKKAFGLYLKYLGFTSCTDGKSRAWRGIAIKYETTA
jgi:hypothetical protein